MTHEKDIIRQVTSDLEQEVTAPITEEECTTSQIKRERDALSSDLRNLREKYYLLEDEVAQHRRKQETRYVCVSETIKMCEVLYSDNTSALLRFDDGDTMLSSSEIQWSDHMNYTAQELLNKAMPEGSVAPQECITAFALLLRKGYVVDESYKSENLPALRDI